MKNKYLVVCFLVFCSFLRIFQENIILYPNPLKDIQTIKIKGYTNQKVKITLYDTQGRSLGTVFEGKLDEENTMLEFDVSHLSNGFYLYDIQLETERRALRFIKQ